jgi:8-oxo-dGTP diphosphatase
VHRPAGRAAWREPARVVPTKPTVESKRIYAAQACDVRSDSREKHERDTVKQRATVVCQLDRRILLVSREGLRWSLPGGKPEAGEDLRDSAIRELEEETRLHATEMQYLFGFTGTRTCHHVFAARLVKGEHAVPSNEITHCNWVKLTDVANISASVSTKGIVEILAIAFNEAPESSAHDKRATSLSSDIYAALRDTSSSR